LTPFKNLFKLSLANLAKERKMKRLEIKDQELERLLEHGIFFHGHLCPAMPLGLRAGLLALRKLGASRAQDKELFLLAETAEGHAMACFLDGVMMATGCTYGKGNCQKLRYGKLAFTLIHVSEKKEIRLSVSGEFILKALETSPFLARRKEGIPPQKIDPELTFSVVQKILDLPEEEVFQLSEVRPSSFSPAKGTFEAYCCVSCGEKVFAPWVRVKGGQFYCLPCSGYLK
jgi:formylmethanofuran dehydrogenase subunit E